MLPKPLQSEAAASWHVATARHLLADRDQGRRVELDGLLKGVEIGLRELSDIITRTQLSLPGGMQPLWGPDQRREVP